MVPGGGGGIHRRNVDMSSIFDSTPSPVLEATVEILCTWFVMHCVRQMSGMNMAKNIKSKKITESRCLRVLLRFLHSVVCLLPKVPHTVRSAASFLCVRYPLVYLRSSSSCSCLLPRLPVICILLSILLSRACFRRQFLRQMWPIELAFLTFIVCKTFVPVLDSV